jgi:hypothetical protein
LLFGEKWLIPGSTQEPSYFDALDVSRSMRQQRAFLRDGCGWSLGSGLVALTGIEPVRPYERAILSRLRLPIPPQGHVFGFIGLYVYTAGISLRQLRRFTSRI